MDPPESLIVAAVVAAIIPPVKRTLQHATDSEATPMEPVGIALFAIFFLLVLAAIVLPKWQRSRAGR